jgi:hypothetical protein
MRDAVIALACSALVLAACASIHRRLHGRQNTTD